MGALMFNGSCMEPRYQRLEAHLKGQSFSRSARTSGLGKQQKKSVSGSRDATAALRKTRALTCALLLQPADLGVQPLQRVGVVLLQEEQVLLSAVQLVLQRHVRRRHVGT